MLEYVGICFVLYVTLRAWKIWLLRSRELGVGTRRVAVAQVVAMGGAVQVVLGLAPGAIPAVRIPPPPPAPKPPQAAVRKTLRPALGAPALILPARGLPETRDCREERAQLRWHKLPCGPDNRRK